MFVSRAHVYYYCLMEQNDNKQELSTTSIVSITLFFISLVLVLLVVQLYNFGVYYILLLIFPFTSLMFATRSNRVGKARKFRVPLIVGSAVLTAFSALIVLIGGFRYSIEAGERNQELFARETSTIVYAQEHAPAKMMELYSDSGAGYSYRYYDDDGKVVEKFREMTFTSYNASSNDISFGTLWFHIDHSNVRFSLDYQYAEVRTTVTKTGLPGANKRYDYHNVYSCDVTEVTALKALIDAKVEEQNQIYQTSNSFM